MDAEVGQELQAARISRGIELGEVEEETKIRAKYLRAIEDGRWEELPGEPYTTGFLRSYAEFLELDAGDVVAAYRRGHPPVDEPTEIPETMLPRRGLAEGAASWATARLVVALIVAAALALIVVVLLTGGSEDAGNRGRAGGQNAAPAPQSTTSPHAQAESRPAKVSLELRSIGTVWVCLVDNRGRTLVDGETLTADERRGPFEARGFEATFGNGAIAMSVGGKPVQVPELGEPLGYAIGPHGVDRLGASKRPTCV
jgi:cytoskeletal protein RodZ